MQELYVDTADALEQLCEQLAGSPWLAVDTEFVREKSYHPKLCLLQLCDGEIAACIDPLKLEDLAPLERLLLNSSGTKVFHAGRQDLEIFYLLWQRLPAPLFDTQLAATLLGLGEQVGYAALVQKQLGVDLAKSHTRTDWSLRPLRQGQLRYALDDVIYLGRVYLALKGELERLGRIDWLAEEFAALADPATYRIDPDTVWEKVKGRQRLKGAQLATLQVLAAWREKQALAADRPRRWILQDDPLIDLARQAPQSLEALSRIRGLEPGQLKRSGARWLELIAESRALPSSEWPSQSRPSKRISANQEAIVDLLMSALRLLAEQQRTTPALLASRQDLERLTAGSRDIDLLRGWRRKIAGDALLSVLNGVLEPRLENGRLVLVKSAIRD
ncbi:MAG: ribonuclease D [Gammaproteobacteria bacterium]|nr:ribonuclease D [Gammaproteobacteria bacterium]